MGLDSIDLSGAMHDAGGCEDPSDDTDDVEGSQRDRPVRRLKPLAAEAVGNLCILVSVVIPMTSRVLNWTSRGEPIAGGRSPQRYE